MVLSIFLCLTAVSAGDVNQTMSVDESSQDILTSDVSGDESSDDSNLDLNGDVLGIEDNQEEISASNVINTTTKYPPEYIFLKNSKFHIQIFDDNGVGVSKKPVSIFYNKHLTVVNTTTDGHIYFKLNAKGTYYISYSFNEKGYAPLNITKRITVIDTSTSKITSSNVVTYAGVKTDYTATLTAGGIALPNQKVKFVVGGKSYQAITNSKGQATLSLSLSNGHYNMKFYYSGRSNVNSTTGSVKITVYSGIKTKILRANNVIYRHTTQAPFKIKLVDNKGNVLANEKVKFIVNKKTYYKTTSKYGIASIPINLKQGSYKISVSHPKSSKYLYSYYSCKIKVKPHQARNNGFWLFGADMKKVNLNQAAELGIKHIFLNSAAFDFHGKTAVSKFATKAKSLGIKVHIWMQVFYKGKWISPVNSDGTFKTSLFNSEIKKAKEYASVKGVSGIHFDYLRFPGNANKYENSVEAINYFTKQICSELHKMDSNLIVSAAVMPEPSSNKYYYGQDIPTLTKYLDVIVPMVYKGNYGQSTSWIKSTTATFVKQSSGAQVWAGLQGYYSDSNVKKLPASTLMNDADAAALGGAWGVIVFRYTLFNMINFRSI